MVLLPNQIVDEIVRALPFEDLWLRCRSVSKHRNEIAKHRAKILFYQSSDIGIDAYGFEAPPLCLMAEPLRPVESNEGPEMLQWASRKVFSEIPGE